MSLKQTCEEIFIANLELDWFSGVIAATAVVLAIWLLVQQAFIEFRKMEQAAPKTITDDRSIPQRAIEFVEALPNLINALANAKAPIVLFTVGLALLWLPDTEPGPTCVKVIDRQLKSPQG